MKLSYECYYILGYYLCKIFYSKKELSSIVRCEQFLQIGGSVCSLHLYNWHSVNEFDVLPLFF